MSSKKGYFYKKILTYPLFLLFILNSCELISQERDIIISNKNRNTTCEELIKIEKEYCYSPLKSQTELQK
jgi:hypothetical protein